MAAFIQVTLARRLRRACLFIALLPAWSAGLAQHEAHHPTPTPPTDQPLVFLDKNPRIVAYQLGRLSNAQLLRVHRDTSHPRYIPVYEAILQRPGMEAKHREQAVRALAKLRQTDEAAEVIVAVGRLEGDQAAAVVAELVSLLLAQGPELLKKHEADLLALAGETAPTPRREAAFAALTACQPADAVWTVAEQRRSLASLLASLPLQPDPARRAAFAPRVEPLLRPGIEPAVLRGAIAAAVALPGREGVVFGALTRLLAAGIERSSVVQAVRRVSRDRWPAEQLAALAQALLDYARAAPVRERTEAAYLEALQLGHELAAALPDDQAAGLRQALAGLAVTMVRLRALPEQMYFDKTLIVVEAGKPVAIIFENPDAMQHNLVIVAPDALERVGQAAEKLPPTPDAEGRLYVPALPEVLAATRLLNRGEQAILKFLAPAQPDRYPYVCTFPGHWLRMRGVLLVVENLQAYLAATPAEPQAPALTAWRLDDFTAELERPLTTRDPAKGKERFTTAGCAACHRVGSLGVDYGPDLTGVFAKYQHNARAVLAEILEPSKNVEARYRNYEFALADGDNLTGLIVKEEPDSWTIQTGASDSLIRKYPKQQIQGREPQASSVMPGGLLGLLSKEEILDLLAFLAGSSTPPAP